MSGGFLSSFSGALDGVTEADAEDAARARQDQHNAASSDADSGVFAGAETAEAQTSGEATGAPIIDERPPAQVRNASPEVRSAAEAFLASTIYTSPVAASTSLDSVNSALGANQDLGGHGGTGAHLWVHTDESARQVLYGEPILVGRGAPASDVAFLEVANDKVSREHCGVRVVDGVAVCSDLGSTNGTWVLRGSEVIAVHDEPVRLQSGDKLTTMVNRVVIAEISESPERP